MTAIPVFIKSNWIGIAIAVIGLVITFFSTSAIEAKTLGDFEEETEATVGAKKRNIKIWVLFWTAWTFYFSISALLTKSLAHMDHFFLMALSTTPGVFGAVVSEYMRGVMIKQEEGAKEEQGSDYTPYYLTTDRIYLSGYYGFLCLPLYIVIIVIGLFIKSLV